MRVYVVFTDFGYEGCSQPEAVYSSNDEDSFNQMLSDFPGIIDGDADDFAEGRLIEAVLATKGTASVYKLMEVI